MIETNIGGKKNEDDVRKVSSFLGEKSMNEGEKAAYDSKGMKLQKKVIDTHTRQVSFLIDLEIHQQKTKQEETR